jgi:hypothetical protein
LFRKNEFQTENIALIFLLKGACLRQMKLYLQAEDYLIQVLELEKEIKEDSYIVPFASVELAMLIRDQGKNQEAISLLEDVK